MKYALTASLIFCVTPAMAWNGCVDYDHSEDAIWRGGYVRGVIDQLLRSDPALCVEAGPPPATSANRLAHEFINSGIPDTRTVADMVEPFVRVLYKCND